MSADDALNDPSAKGNCPAVVKLPAEFKAFRAFCVRNGSARPVICCWTDGENNRVRSSRNSIRGA